MITRANGWWARPVPFYIDVQIIHVTTLSVGGYTIMISSR